MRLFPSSWHRIWCRCVSSASSLEPPCYWHGSPENLGMMRSPWALSTAFIWGFLPKDEQHFVLVIIRYNKVSWAPVGGCHLKCYKDLSFKNAAPTNHQPTWMERCFFPLKVGRLKTSTQKRNSSSRHPVTLCSCSGLSGKEDVDLKAPQVCRRFLLPKRWP